MSKSSDIEEKNIQNKATKYKVSLSANVIVIELNSGRELTEHLILVKHIMLKKKNNTLNNMRDQIMH